VVFGGVGRVMSVTANELQQLLEPTIEGMGYECVGIEVHAYQGKLLIRVYADGEKGITVGELQQISHQLSGLLEVQNAIPQAYHLEVSSPGLDRLLFKKAHYERFVGHRIKLTTRLPVDGRRNYTGQLVAVEGLQIIIMVDNEQITLSFDNIEKARVVPEWDLPKKR